MNISFQTFLFLNTLDRYDYAHVSADLDTFMWFVCFNAINCSMCCESPNTSDDLDTCIVFTSFNAINCSMCCESPNTSDDLDTFMWFVCFNAFNPSMCCESPTLAMILILPGPSTVLSRWIVRCVGMVVRLVQPADS